LPEEGDELERRFEGRAVLEKLLVASGTLADPDDVKEVFTEAVKQGAPASVVIQALWDDEPRFESPQQAKALFSNLLGLYDLVASGQAPDLAVPAPKERVKKVKAEPPEPFSGEPTDEFVESAWRFLDDHPKERERLGHAFENRQDALLSWLDASGLSDGAFGLARSLLGDVFAMVELGGHKTGSVSEVTIEGATAASLPEAFQKWIDEGFFEAEEHETEPLPQDEAERGRKLTAQAAAAMWLSRA
jgi:hypothetical protein